MLFSNDQVTFNDGQLYAVESSGCSTSKKGKSNKGNKVKGKPKEDENIASQSRPKPKSKKVEIVCSDQVTFNDSQLYAVESSGCSTSKKGNKVKGKPEEDENIASQSRPKKVEIVCSDQVTFNDSQLYAVESSGCSTSKKGTSKKGNKVKGDENIASKSRKPRSKKVEIVCSDQTTFHVGKLYAMESCVVNNRIEYGFVSPLRLDFRSQIISVVLDFCKKHAETRITNGKDAHEKLRDFNSEFLKENQNILVDLLRVALRLQIKSLLHLTSETVVDMINEKTAEEIHKMLNMKQDLNSKDMEMLLELDDWCFA